MSHWKSLGFNNDVLLWYVQAQEIVDIQLKQIYTWCPDQACLWSLLTHKCWRKAGIPWRERLRYP